MKQGRLGKQQTREAPREPARPSATSAPVPAAAPPAPPQQAGGTAVSVKWHKRADPAFSTEAGFRALFERYGRVDTVIYKPDKHRGIVVFASPTSVVRARV
jgi:hypothetical protein